MIIPSTKKVIVYEVQFDYDEIDEDGKVIDYEHDSDRMNFETISAAEKYIKNHPVGTVYEYADGERVIVSKIWFDYEPTEIEVYLSSKEREELQRAADTEERIDRFKRSDFTNRDLVCAAMCLETYISMPECTESEGMKDDLREIIHKLHFVAGTLSDY